MLLASDRTSRPDAPAHLKRHARHGHRCDSATAWDAPRPCSPPAHTALVLLSHKIRDHVFIWIATARCSILAYLHPDRGAGMDGGSSEGSEARFAGYVETLGVVLGHADRQQPMHDYCLGLLPAIERKSVEPMA